MGALRRRITIATAPGQARAALEDDFHHFRVAVSHDSEKVTDIRSQGFRYPFDVCPAAGDVLKTYVGAPLSGSFLELLGQTDRLQHCTHQLELACLAITGAFHQCREKCYEIQVDDPDADRPRRSVLWVDGDVALDWQVQDDRIVSPGEFEGIDLRGGFRGQLLDLSPSTETVERAMVLRRGIFISKGRHSVWSENAASMVGACYAFQPERVDVAVRTSGTIKDFSTTPEPLLRDDKAWLEKTANGEAFRRPL